LNLDKDALIMDMGCGPGYFLDEMKARGYTNLVGVTLSPEDTRICTEKGHNIKAYDMSFIPQADGFYDESVDFIFCRHAMEHSPYPIITLAEYNRLLKLKGKFYMEVPAPDSDRRHEYNSNHYSVLGLRQWDALLQRAGFSSDSCNTLEFDIEIPKEDGAEEKVQMKEKYFIFMANKKCPLDIK
jgi:SAM-dependent methyltransferase